MTAIELLMVVNSLTIIFLTYRIARLERKIYGVQELS
jgi:hypothetical protein